MEPLHPALRAALKEAHPGLKDEDIDRVEALLSQRALYDPDTEAGKIKQLDRERMNLIRERMPRYDEVLRTFRAARDTGAARKPKVSVVPKPKR